MPFIDYWICFIKVPFVHYFIDRNGGVYEGWTRPDFRMTPLNYTTGKYDEENGVNISYAISADYVYPEGVPPGDYYYIDTGTKLYCIPLIKLFECVIFENIKPTKHNVSQGSYEMEMTGCIIPVETFAKYCIQIQPTLMKLN